MTEPEAVSVQGSGRFADIWQPPYRRRALMLIVFHVFQAIGFFGFGNWLPALLSGQGVSVTHSLLYAFIITLAYPLGPLLFVKFANRFENKWQIVGSALGSMTFGTLFAWQTSAFGLIALLIADLAEVQDGALVLFTSRDQMRQAVTALEHYQHGHLDQTQATNATRLIDAAVQDMIANCKLAPDADAALHVLIAKFVSGADAVRSGRDVSGSIKSMQDALAQYPTQFDDPTWDVNPED